MPAAAGKLLAEWESFTGDFSRLRLDSARTVDGQDKLPPVVSTLVSRVKPINGIDFFCPTFGFLFSAQGKGSFLSVPGKEINSIILRAE